MELKRLFEIPELKAKKSPSHTLFCTKENGVWNATSAAEFSKKINQLSRGFFKLGVQPGDKIAIINHASMAQWHVIDYAIQQSGAVSVPVYPNISSDDYSFIFSDAEVKFCFVTNKELFDKVNVIKDKVSSLQEIYSIYDIEGVSNWKEVLEWGDDESLQEEVEKTKQMVKPSDLVTIIYTSGTTGNPKGVMLTHNNVLSNVKSAGERFPPLPNNSQSLSFLPVCHIFERVLTYIYQEKGITINFAESIETMADNLKEVNPHVMSVVPRLLEKVYASIYEKGQAAGGVKTKLFNWAISLVEDYEPFKKMGFVDRVKYKFASKLVFSKWREGLGGNLVAMVSGAAALSPRLAHIFNGAGIPVLEGYGMTETSPVVSVNGLSPDFLRIGTVGKIIDDVEVKIAGDGEILVKGPNVTQGYYKNPEKTKELFNEDGYLKTGDIGELDADGFLKITDRKKEIFKTSGGKYIAPQPMENEMKQSRFIEQIMIAGEGEKMPVALIQPNFEVAKEWLNEQGEKASSHAEISTNSKLIDAVMRDVDKTNESFGSWEKVKKIALTPDEWTIEEGLLTPTMKMKRKKILAKYRVLYDGMYDR